MTHIYMKHDEDGDLILKTPYVAEFVEALKDLVDQDSRQWSAGGKFWRVDGAYEAQVEQLLNEYFNFAGQSQTSRTPSRRGRLQPSWASPTPDPTADEIRKRQRTQTPPGAKPRTVDRNTGEIIEKKLPGRPEMQETIRSLTARISALKYENEHLEERHTADQTQLRRSVGQIHQLERQVAELTFKLNVAEASTRHAPNNRFWAPNRDGSWGFNPMGGLGPTPLEDAYRTLHLDPSATPEVVEAAWKALIRAHHPDLGGDVRRAQEINAAHDRILTAQGAAAHASAS